MSSYRMMHTRPAPVVTVYDSKDVGANSLVANLTRLPFSGVPGPRRTLHASWPTEAIIGWAGTPRNIGHMMSEFRAIYIALSKLPPKRRQLIIYNGGYFRGSNFIYLLSLLPGIDPIIVEARETGEGRWWDQFQPFEGPKGAMLKEPICYAEVHVAPFWYTHTHRRPPHCTRPPFVSRLNDPFSSGCSVPTLLACCRAHHLYWTKDFVQTLAQQSGVCAGPKPYAPLRALILQRRSTRALVNMHIVVRTLKAHGFAEADVRDLDGLLEVEQLRLACQAHLVVGAHGAGMAWSVFANGGRPEGAAVLEINQPYYARCDYSLIGFRIGFGGKLHRTYRESGTSGWLRVRRDTC